MKPRILIASLTLSSLAAPLAAESASSAFQNPGTQTRAAATSPLAQFTPASERKEHQLDYAHWDEALNWFVVPMGPSTRDGATRVVGETGSRRVYGHDSRYRLEGNRVAFSFLTPGMLTALTEYRQDLERIGSELDLTRLPRNEQLAFWLNLHNVAVIEALALSYPLAEPHEGAFGSNKAPLEEAKLVTVRGVELSPRDIREGIVYPNWKDPKVMYGFWRGVIGGPSIQRLAYTGANVDALLALSAEEFVNSLRGVERWGGALRVSPIYQEAAPFYFGDKDALRDHLAQYAREDVAKLVSGTPDVRYKSLELDIADLQRGHKDLQVASLSVAECKYNGCMDGGKPIGISSGTGSPQSVTLNPAIQRLIRERREKLDRARKQGIRTGMVIYGDGQYAEGEAPPEVE